MASKKIEKSIKDLIETHSVLKYRVDYLKHKKRDVCTQIKSCKNKKEQKGYLNKTIQLDKLTEQTIDQMFVIDLLIDSIVNIRILGSSTIEDVVGKLCISAIEDALDSTHEAIDKANEINDLMSTPFSEETISDSELNDFLGQDTFEQPDTLPEPETHTLQAEQNHNARVLLPVN